MKYVVRMSAGLANRMFQYAYYLYLQNQGKEVYVDNKYKPTKWKMEDIEWEKIFPHAPIKQAPDALIFKYGGGYNWLDKVRRHYLRKFCRVWIMENSTQVPMDNDLSRFGYFIGVYQDASMVDAVKDKVIETFKFPDLEPKSSNAEIAAKMKEENSVAIHFRKGKDYMIRTPFHGTCPVEYYQKAVNIIREKVSNPVFYVFTDNVEWVKNNFKGIDYTLVEGNPAIGWGNHFDMQLMSCCRHNIIANSTYSWWGAYLNSNPDKIVIDPKYWFNPELPYYRNFANHTACKDWILL